jgi:hypothetical protein
LNTMDTLERDWRRRSGAAFHATPVMTDEGILFGAGTILVHRTADRFDVARDAERAIGLLSIARRGPAGVHLLHHFRKAAVAWSRGEKALAQFHLAYAKIPPLESREDAKRLFLAEALIAAGVLPLQLARMVGTGPPEIQKGGGYNPDQPRNPAGSGEDSGRWTKEPAAGGNTPEAETPARSKVAFVTAPPSLVGTALSAEAASFLLRLASKATAAGLAIETFRTIFVPSPNDGVVAQGELPGQPGVRYEVNHDSGTLKIDASATGADQPIVAMLGQGGIYREVETGVMIARNLGDGIVMLDPDLLATLDRPKGSGDTENPPWGGSGGWLPPTGPKLCPDPVPERGANPKDFASIYQQFVRDYVNPQRVPQMPLDITHALPASTPSGWVKYDDCRESNGNMIEAKSDQTGYMHTPIGEGRLKERYLEQAGRQYRALKGRSSEWYFHRKENADFARQLFDDNKFSDKISVFHLPYSGTSPDPRPGKKP